MIENKRKYFKLNFVLEASFSSSNLKVSIESEKLLVFSATPFKIHQNKKQNRSIDKVQNLGNERR